MEAAMRKRSSSTESADSAMAKMDYTITNGLPVKEWIRTGQRLVSFPSVIEVEDLQLKQELVCLHKWKIYGFSKEDLKLWHNVNTGKTVLACGLCRPMITPELKAHGLMTPDSKSFKSHVLKQHNNHPIIPPLRPEVGEYLEDLCQAEPLFEEAVQRRMILAREKLPSFPEKALEKRIRALLAKNITRIEYGQHIKTGESPAT